MTGFWSAGLGASAIPDSVKYQWTASNFTSPWVDNISGESMSLSGGLTQDTFPNGETSVVSDGSDDGGVATGARAIPTNETFAIAFTFRYDRANQSVFARLTASRDGSSSRFGIQADDSKTGFLLRNPPGSTSDGRAEAFLDNDLGDNNTHLVVWNKPNDNVNDWEIYVDDMATPVGFSINYNHFDHTDFNTSGIDHAFFANNKSGTLDEYWQGEVGTFEFNVGSVYSQSDRDSLKSRLPEV